VYIDACYQAGPLLFFPKIYGILAETPAFRSSTQGVNS
jgi:hypothetical protein